MGLNILPFLMELYAAYNRRINGELLCKVFTRNTSGERGSDCGDSVIRYLCANVCITNNGAASVKRVLRVLGVRTRNQVRRINAFWVVA